MLKALVAGAVLSLALFGAANAQTCGALTNLVNGTTADASQVMTNFNAVRNCAMNAGVLPGYLNGLTLSTAGANTFTMQKGQATDSTGVASMVLAAAMSKTTSAWSAGAGNGSLDTGSIAANAWYHAFLIENTTTGVVDVLTSASATSPLLPSGFSYARRIGSMKTNGSSNWTPFVQFGDRFEWVTSVLDVNGASPTPGNQFAQAITTPLGVITQAILHAGLGYNNGFASTLRIYPTYSQGGQSIPLITSSVPGNGNDAETVVTTNTSSQVLVLMGYVAPAGFSIETMGWIDQRGR